MTWEEDTELSSFYVQGKCRRCEYLKATGCWFVDVFPPCFGRDDKYIEPKGSTDGKPSEESP